MAVTNLIACIQSFQFFLFLHTKRIMFVRFLYCIDFCLRLLSVTSAHWIFSFTIMYILCILVLDYGYMIDGVSTAMCFFIWYVSIAHRILMRSLDTKYRKKYVLQTF